ncbi:site-specific integrase [Noviherbaspirillum pedocola]|uniref:Site-specific integrase n=1 Tax=Noviherbaspirillum pedocola TaxID=2801341 RepID=A0A934SYI3_9BURK|nr:site-specific integrase [Noviherbaspirillum pedocola]MBK4739201.1 site-specific integrase [Noviherbaspirillum pedocola]
MQEYETIKRARAMLQASRTEPAERTVATYKRRGELLMQTPKGQHASRLDAVIAKAKRSKSASTWFGNRAALMFGIRRGIEAALSTQDKMQRELKSENVPENDIRWQEWRDIVAKVSSSMQWIERLQNEPGPPVGERKPRHSKRKDLRGLPDDWRERIVARMPKYRLAVLAQAVTGCRPEELVSGVQLEIRGGQLVATIDGVKVSEKSGQEWRRLSWPIDSASPLIRDLVREVEAGASLAQIRDAKAYSGAMRAAGARAWPRRKATVTPYCLRHAAASDFKASGMDSASISEALGHSSEVTKKYYGSWHQARGGSVAPQSVEAARKLKRDYGIKKSR